jgi:methyl-accepting chemotaxis protein
MTTTTQTRSLTIGTLLYFLLGAMLLMLCSLLAVSMVDAVKRKSTAERVVEMARANRDVFIALQNLRVERGPTRTALGLKDAASDAQLAYFKEARAKSGPALAAVIAGCGQINCFDAGAAAQLRAASERLAAMRVESDQALRQPLEARRSGIVQDFNAASTQVVELLEKISLFLTAEVRAVNSFTAEQSAIKNAAYITRDAAGLERDYITRAINIKAFEPERRAKMHMLRGNAEAGWRMVLDLADRPGIPATVVAAIKGVDQTYFGEFLKLRASIEKAIDAGEPSPMSVAEFSRTLDVSLGRIVAVVDAALEATVIHAAENASAAWASLLRESGLMLAALALSAGGLFVVRNRALLPLGTISDAMLRVARGDVAVEIPFRDRGDEIGQLAGSLEVFRQNAIAARQAEAEKLAAQAEKERRQHAVEDHLGAFDRSVRQALQTLDAASTAMRGTAEGMTGTAEETSRKTKAAAVASERASVNVQTVAAATEELSASIVEIGRQVSQSATIAGKAVDQANRTNATVQGLAQAAQSIGEVVRMIQDIAGQTNLLALNATIEAARAGEAGKGFAVVASEVKSLANQTAKATESITAQIAAIQGATGEAVGAIQHIGGTIAEINTIASAIAAAVEEQGAATQEIARNVQEAARGTGDVASNIEGVDSAARHAGDAASAVLSAADDLRNQAESLQQGVGDFFAKIRAA